MVFNVKDYEYNIFYFFQQPLTTEMGLEARC